MWLGVTVLHGGPFQRVWKSWAVQLPLLVMETAQLMCRWLHQSFSFSTIIEWAAKHTKHTSITAAPWLDACLLLHSESCSVQSLSEGICSYLGGGELHPVLYTMWSCWQWVFLRGHVECLWNTRNEVERNSLLGCFRLGKMCCCTQQSRNSR